MRRLHLETLLDCPADTAWREELKIAHLLRISRPLIVFGSNGETHCGCWTVGQVIELRGRLFGLIPLGRHRVEVVALDPERRRIVTEEGGGPIRLWRHRVTISPVTSDRCRYSDDLEIEAGALTGLVWGLAALTYRIRQARWRGLARRLADSTAKPFK